jgi:RND family efflux transporter MFP subunit
MGPRTAGYWAVLIGGSLLVGVACGPAEPPAEAQLRPVRTVTVQETGAERSRSFSGQSEAGTESRLSFKVPGTVIRVGVEVGSRVEPGDLIARLDARDYELAVQEAEAGLARARAELTAARSEYERIRRLYENRNASKSQLDSARAAFESSQASVEASEKRLEQAELRLGYTRLTAPTAGRIASVPVDRNENVQAGQPIATLTSGERPRVTVGIPEQLISQIESGDRVEVRFDALPIRSFTATVTEVAVAPLPGGATFPVTARLEDAAETVRPGMAATVTFRFRQPTRAGRFVIPAVAVSEDRRGRFVFTVEPVEPGVGVVHRQRVTVGDLTDAGMVILDGLEEGAMVVTAGISRIEEGMRVAVPEGDGER